MCKKNPLSLLKGERRRPFPFAECFLGVGYSPTHFPLPEMYFCPEWEYRYLMRLQIASLCTLNSFPFETEPWGERKESRRQEGKQYSAAASPSSSAASSSTSWRSTLLGSEGSWDGRRMGSPQTQRVYDETGTDRAAAAQTLRCCTNSNLASSLVPFKEPRRRKKLGRPYPHLRGSLTFLFSYKVHLPPHNGN